MNGASWESEAGRLAREALADGQPTAWFERLYAGDNPLPWDEDAPRPSLVELATEVGVTGPGRAIVVGCGLGQNSEYVARLGYDTLAFDIAPTAIRVARERYPSSTVEYTVADLLDPPFAWQRAFDLVVEVYTVQALPDPPRAQAIANIAALVAPGGTLLVVAAARAEHEPAPDGPPWPLARHEIDAFAAVGDLVAVRTQERPDPAGARRWLAEFRRPSGD